MLCVYRRAFLCDVDDIQLQVLKSRKIDMLFLVISSGFLCKTTVKSPVSKTYGSRPLKEKIPNTYSLNKVSAMYTHIGQYGEE